MIEELEKAGAITPSKPAPYQYKEEKKEEAQDQMPSRLRRTKNEGIVTSEATLLFHSALSEHPSTNSYEAD